MLFLIYKYRLQFAYGLYYFLFMRTTSNTKNDQENSSRKYNTKCVCQVCVCGRHRCPPGNKPFSGQTTYNYDYKPCSAMPTTLRRPCTSHYHERHYDPNVLKTSYDTQYIPHQIENNQIYNKNSPTKYDYRPRTAKFAGDTQYKTNYLPKEVPREQSPSRNRAYYSPTKSGKFQGTTTYNAQFSPKKAENAYKPPNYTYERRKVPFQGKTTYNTQYIPHQIQPTWNNNNNRSYYEHSPNKKTKFEGETDYKASYKPYQLQKQSHCPILDLPQYPRKCSPGKDHVNYVASKNEWQ